MRGLWYLISIPALAFSLYGQRWEIQYFYDEPKTELNIADLAFPTIERGIAVGWIQQQDRKPKPASIVTNDGGAHWSMAPIEDMPRSLFFLNDSTGWMVTEDAIWFTDEGGRSWRKLVAQRKPNKKLGPAPPGGLIMRVWFRDAQNGYAIGYQKTVLQTADGGKTWTDVPDAAKPTGNPAFTAYSQIAFEGPRGLIAGASIPPRPDLGKFPSWMDPERAAKAKQVATLTLLLETVDGGMHWRTETAPLIGIVSDLKMSGRDAIDVFSYSPSFQWPSEVYRIDLTTGKSTSIFRVADRRVTSVGLYPGSQTFLAAIEPTGRLNTAPIPGKVKILTSSNFSDWKEMDVDYRAVATTLMLAGPDARHVWAATDTGMILKLSN